MDNTLSNSVKLPTTFEEQINILKSRGLIIENEDLAIRTLQRINYYRFSAYGLSLKQKDRFIPGTTFDRDSCCCDADSDFKNTTCFTKFNMLLLGVLFLFGK